MTQKNSRKVLVPLATLLAAGAVAVGSGATFTSQSESTVTVTAGTLVHVNDANQATLTVSNLKPGGTASGTLNIANTGSLNSTLAVSEVVASNTFETGALLLEIKKDGASVWSGNFDAVGSAVSLGALNVGDATDLTFVVSMPVSAGNLNQGKAATATFQFVTTQTATDNESSVLGW